MCVSLWLNSNDETLLTIMMILYTLNCCSSDSFQMPRGNIQAKANNFSASSSKNWPHSCFLQTLFHAIFTQTLILARLPLIPWQILNHMPLNGAITFFSTTKSRKWGTSFFAWEVLQIPEVERKRFNYPKLRHLLYFPAFPLCLNHFRFYSSSKQQHILPDICHKTDNNRHNRRNTGYVTKTHHNCGIYTGLSQ